MSTTASPRLQRTSARGFEHDLADPLPSSLASLIADRADQHRKVAARLDELRRRQVELSREVAASEQADREDAAAAAAAGRDPKRRQKTARLRGLFADVERDVKTFSDAVVRSADALLEAAAPQAGAAIAKAGEDRQRAIDRARELLAALDGALAEAGDLAAERVWLRRLAGGTRSIEPFRAGVGSDPSLGRLRRALADAFLAWEGEEATRQADLDRQKAFEDEHAAEWARQREQAEREDAAARVRFEGPVLTHRGGRPVRPGFQDAEEERRP
jgi:hypothetical protein